MGWGQKINSSACDFTATSRTLEKCRPGGGQELPPTEAPGGKRKLGTEQPSSCAQPLPFQCQRLGEAVLPFWKTGVPAPKLRTRSLGTKPQLRIQTHPPPFPQSTVQSHFYPRRSSFLSWTLQHFSRCSECGTEMAILRLGPSASRVTPAVDQTPSSPTPTPGNTVLASALAPSGQRQVEPTHSVNGLGKAAQGQL